MAPAYTYRSGHSRYPWVHAAISMSMGGRGIPAPDYHEELLASARQLIEGGHTQAAVLVAQMACEVFIGHVIVIWMERRGQRDAKAWAEAYKRSFSFLNPAIFKRYVRFSGERINKSFPRWKDCMRHGQLRNKVAHRGQKVSKSEAEEVCDVAQKLTTHLRISLDKLT